VAASADSMSIEARSSGRFPEAAPALSSGRRSRSRELGQIEGQRESARDLLQLLLVHLLRPLLRLAHRGRHQVLEHLHIRRIDHRRIDLYFTDTTPAVGGYRHHPAAARARHRAISEFRLELCQSGLYLLTHLKKLLEIRHGRSGHRLLKAFPSIDAGLRHSQGEHRPSCDMMVPRGVGEFLRSLRSKAAPITGPPARPPPALARVFGSTRSRASVRTIARGGGLRTVAPCRSEAPGVLDVLDLQFVAGTGRDAADVESKARAGRPVPRDPRMRRSGEVAAFGDGDGLGGRAEAIARAAFDLDECDEVVAPCDEVDLLVPEAPVHGENVPAGIVQVPGDSRFGAAAQLV